MSTVEVRSSITTGAKASVVAALVLLVAATFILLDPIEQPTTSGPPFRCGTAMDPAQGAFAASFCSGVVRGQQLLAAAFVVSALAVALGGIWAFGIRGRAQPHLLLATGAPAQGSKDASGD